MPQYEFQSTLHRNKAEMLYAMAEAWLTAGGANDTEDEAQFLAENTDDALAEECIRGWGLNVAEPEIAWVEPEEALSHMQRDEYTAEDLAAAFARYRARFVEV